MSEVAKLSKEAIKCIGLLQKTTGAHAVDCVVDDYVTFAVPSDQMGMAIGKGGENVRKLSRLLKKRVDFVEYSDTFEKFALNLASPAEPEGVEMRDGVLVVHAKSRARYLLKSDKGKLLKRMKTFLARHYGDIEKVEIEK